jgi:hypothetical protein
MERESAVTGSYGVLEWIYLLLNRVVVVVAIQIIFESLIVLEDCMMKTTIKNN